MGEIIICGASVRSLAQSAVQTGLTPLCVDFFADGDLLRLLRQSGGRMIGRLQRFTDLPAMIQAASPEIPLIWAGGLENYPEVLTSLSRRHRLAGASSESVASVRDPFRLAEAMAEAGVCFPRTIQNHAGQVLDQAVRLRTRWLLKQRNSAGGMGITIAASENSLPRTSVDTCLQEFIDGVSISAMFSTTDIQCELIGVSLQLTGLPSLRADKFRYCGNLGPLQVPDAVKQQIQTAGSVISNWSGLRGIFGADFMLSRGTVWLLEVNPRITASHELYELTQGRNLLREQLDCFGISIDAATADGVAERDRGPSGSLSAEQEPIEQGALRPACVLKMIVYSDRSFVVGGSSRAAANPDETPEETSANRKSIPNDPTQRFPRSWMADLPVLGTPVEAGCPICSVYFSGKDLRDAVQHCAAGCLTGGQQNRDLPGQHVLEGRLSFQQISNDLNRLLESLSRHLHP